MLRTYLKLFRKQRIKLRPIIPGPMIVKVGFPAGKSSQDIINRAVWNHYGTRGGASGGGWGGPIPPRPFLLNSMRRHRNKYKDALRASAAPILRGDVSIPNVLNKLGILSQGDVQMEITNTYTPPNSPTTILLKGSAHPLIDTGQMRQSVTWKLDRAP